MIVKGFGHKLNRNFLLTFEKSFFDLQIFAKKRKTIFTNEKLLRKLMRQKNINIDRNVAKREE